MLIFFLGGVNQSGIDLSSGRVGAQGTTKEQNVGFRAVEGIMLPSFGLLDPNRTPFVFREEARLGNGLGLFVW